MDGRDCHSAAKRDREMETDKITVKVRQAKGQANGRTKEDRRRGAAVGEGGKQKQIIVI